MGYLKLWIPKEMKKKEKENFFIMDATHRGDMYHLRAAMEMGTMKYSVYLYNCHSTERAAVEVRDYLTRSALDENKMNVIVTPWPNYNGDTKNNDADASKPPKPPPIKDCLLNGHLVKEFLPTRIKYETFSERDATEAISRLTSIPDSMINGMHLLKPSSMRTLDERFKKLVSKDSETHWDKVLEKDSPTILVFYRGTGTGSKDGVHPELDSGIKSILFIHDIVQKLPKVNGKQPRIVLAGNPKDIKEFEKIPGIGEYWSKLGATPAGETARDVQAYFLRWAFDKNQNYYQMALSTRSGPFDLLTFMGIPTVSITLRNYAGNYRHDMLAKPPFQRINVEYAQPRQASTAFVSQGTDAPPTFFSPFWDGKFGAPGDVAPRHPTTKEKETLRAEKPGDFKPFDKVIVEVGLKMACAEYLHWATRHESVKYGISYLVTNPFTTRYYYPTGLSKENKIKEVSERKLLDQNDIKQRDAKKLQQPMEVLGAIDFESWSDWFVVKYMVGDFDGSSLVG
ncbi:unnamed protein product [Clonostachys chloroleuca]|uniref:Uncharacterized protein n=1 Tax=Clonostachys chloroleuca TaxID=1926264 RepID=A0AA35M2Z1_9HYPO|nr:unnamed protein product [Clonostachys chloroleuca]